MAYGVNTIVNDLVNYGIIGFDTGMKVMGQTPVLDDHYPHNAPKLKSQPKKDEVIKEDDSLTVASNPKWKKILFGTLVAAGLVFGGYKFKTKLMPLVKKGWNAAVKFVTKPFRRSTPPAPAP